MHPVMGIYLANTINAERRREAAEERRAQTAGRNR